MDPVDKKYIKITDNDNSDITSKVIKDGKISVKITNGTHNITNGKIDLSNPGNYKVTYSISGYSKSLTMNVKVK